MFDFLKNKKKSTDCLSIKNSDDERVDTSLSINIKNKRDFELYLEGYNSGYQNGLNKAPRIGFDINQSLFINKDENISEEDFESFVRYLIVNNLDLYYCESGFMIRKKQ